MNANADPSVTAEFKLSEGEFVAGARRNATSSVWTWLLVTVIEVGLIYWGVKGGVSGWIAAGAFASYWGWYLSGMQSSKFRKSSVAQLPRIVTFTEQGTHMEAGHYMHDQPWRQYRGAVEFPDMYVLRYGLGNATTVVKRGFANPADEARFRELLRRHIKCRFIEKGKQSRA